MKKRRVLALLLGGVVLAVGGIVYLTNINRLVENPEDYDFDEDFDDDFFEDEEEIISESKESEEAAKEETAKETK